MSLNKKFLPAPADYSNQIGISSKQNAYKDPKQLLHELAHSLSSSSTTSSISPTCSAVHSTSSSSFSAHNNAAQSFTSGMETTNSQSMEETRYHESEAKNQAIKYGGSNESAESAFPYPNNYYYYYYNSGGYPQPGPDYPQASSSFAPGSSCEGEYAQQRQLQADLFHGQHNPHTSYMTKSPSGRNLSPGSSQPGVGSSHSAHGYLPAGALSESNYPYFYNSGNYLYQNPQLAHYSSQGAFGNPPDTMRGNETFYDNNNSGSSFNSINHFLFFLN